MDTEDARTLDAQGWAAKLLRDLGADDFVPPAGPSVHPALRWAECGAMALTGRLDGPPLMCPVPLASCADGALLALAAIAEAPDGVLPRGGELLTERAAMTGLSRSGRVSPGGGCRLLDCADGRIALTLARAHDWAALPAFLGEKWPGPDSGATEDGWRAVAEAVSALPVDELVERGRLLSLAIAADRLPDETDTRLVRDRLRTTGSTTQPGAHGRWSWISRRSGPGRSARTCLDCWVHGS